MNVTPSRRHAAPRSASLIGRIALAIIAAGWAMAIPAANAAIHPASNTPPRRASSTGSDDSYTVISLTPNPSNALQQITAHIAVFDTTTSCTFVSTCDHPLGFVEIDIDGAYTTLVPLTAGASPDVSQTTYNTSTLTPGTHTITAAYQGDVTFAPSTASADQVVNQLTSTTSLSQSSTTSRVGMPVTFTATVAGSDGGTPTGQVQFFRAGSPYGSPQNLVGATATLSAAPPTGTNTFTARYLGDTNYESSVSDQVSHPVTTASSLPELTSSPNPSACNQRVSLEVTVLSLAFPAPTPTGTVTFFDGAVSLGTTDLSAGVADTFTPSLTPGSHSLSAVYNGDTNFDRSSSLPVTQVVNDCTTPVALNDTYTTPQDTAMVAGDPGVLSNDLHVDPSVPDGASLQTSPAHGAVTLSPAGGFTYTPTAGFTGDDTFTYCVSGDPDLVQCTSNIATATITVTPSATTTTTQPATTTTTAPGTTTTTPPPPPTTTTTAPGTTTITTAPADTTTSTVASSTTTSTAPSPTTQPGQVAGTQETNDPPTDPPAGSTSGVLPVTGTNTLPLFEFGLGLLTVGATATILARRKAARPATR